MFSARRRSASAAAALSAVVVVALAACSGSTDAGTEASPTAADPAASTAAADAFPVTIDDAFGGTTIESAPERVVTWGWGSTDAAIALGVVPVAMPAQSYAGDAEGVLPWIREAVETAGETLPTVLPDSGDDVPYEDIAAAEPDLILAPYSGITQEQYDTLTQIAPVVAYPETPWATPWRDVVTITGEALGLPDEAAAVLADIDQQVADQKAAHPEFEGLTLATAWGAADTVYVYADEDPRVEFMLDLGFVNAPAVDALDTDESSFYFTLSPERLVELSSDVLVAYGTTEEELATFLSSPAAQVMPQVQQGAVAQVVGAQKISAVSPPTALSLSWGLQDVVDQLATAVAAHDA